MWGLAVAASMTDVGTLESTDPIDGAGEVRITEREERP
jgi:hypothetical protein